MQWQDAGDSTLTRMMLHTHRIMTTDLLKDSTLKTPAPTRQRTSRMSGTAQAVAVAAWRPRALPLLCLPGSRLRSRQGRGSAG